MKTEELRVTDWFGLIYSSRRSCSRQEAMMSPLCPLIHHGLLRPLPLPSPEKRQLHPLHCTHSFFFNVAMLVFFLSHILTNVNKSSPANKAARLGPCLLGSFNGLRWLRVISREILGQKEGPLLRPGDR